MALINCPECGKEISDKAPSCPNCGNPIRSGGQGNPPKPEKKKTGCLTWAGVGIIALIVIVGIVGKEDGESTLHSIASTGQESTPASEADRADLPSMTAVQLQKEFEANEVAANQKYQGKKLVITGTIDSIDLTITGAPSVKLRSTNQFLPISADLERDQKDAAAQLSKGGRFTAVCTVGHFIMGTATLSDCTISD